jgi:hypothetical protein
MIPYFDDTTLMTLIDMFNSTAKRTYTHGDSFGLIDAHCPRLGMSNEGDACKWEAVGYMQVLYQGIYYMVFAFLWLLQLGQGSSLLGPLIERTTLIIVFSVNNSSSCLAQY